MLMVTVVPGIVSMVILAIVDILRRCGTKQK